MYLLNTNTFVNPTECLKYQQSGILYKIIQASNEKKVIDQDLKHNKY